MVPHIEIGGSMDGQMLDTILMICIHAERERAADGAEKPVSRGKQCRDSSGVDRHQGLPQRRDQPSPSTTSRQRRRRLR